ncbi:hypothetical protein V8D89_000768 [Ganoderma adspersum]
MVHSPPTKRIKLESSPHLEADVILPIVDADEDDEGEGADGEHCSICLQPYADRTMIPTCSHEFCFECLLIWTDQSRRCPLCSQDVGKYLMHNVRSKYDYQKHYLAPLRTSPQPQAIAAVRVDARRRAERRREVEWGHRRRRELAEADELDRAIEKRRWVYRNNLFAKHVASNPYTRYRPFPTPAQFGASQDLISRATVFIRRELQAWVGLDVEFLTTFTVSLMKSLDIRSEPAVRLLSEFLDMDAEQGRERANAEHFAHELYSYLRSPYRDLSAYDNNVQYDVPETIPPPNALERRQRWRSRSRSRSHPSPREVPSARSRRHPPTSRSTSRDSSSHSDRLGTSPLRSHYEIHESSHHPSESQHLRTDDSRSRRIYRPRSSESRPSGSYRAEQRRDTTGHARSGRSRGSYNEKGKDRAEDVRAGGLSLPASRRDSVVAVGISGHPTTIGSPRHSSCSRASGENSPGTSTLSTPHEASDLSAATRDVGANVPAPLAVLRAPHGDTGGPTPHTPEDVDVATPSSQLDPTRPARPPGRVRRNAWQTMQDHLASSGRDPRSRQPREGASAPERASSKSQAPSVPASFPRDRALRPGDLSPADEAVPSLLLRLSDPVRTTSVYASDASHNAPDGSPAAPRDALSASKGRGISAPEMTTRTRAGPLTQSPERADPSYASHAARPHKPGGAAGSQVDLEYDAATGRAGDVDAAGTVGPMSSEPTSGRATPLCHIDCDARKLIRTSFASGYSVGTPQATRAGRGAQPSPRTAAAADPRFVLMQKLEEEKRRAVDVPTAEKAQLSSSATAGHDAACVPMVLPADVRREGHTKSAVPGAEGVAAERQAERREAELRSQAQLRVRLAAAKRAAALQVRDDGASGRADDGNTGTGPGDPLSISIGDGLMSQENALRSKLKARKP